MRVERARSARQNATNGDEKRRERARRDVDALGLSRRPVTRALGRLEEATRGSKPLPRRLRNGDGGANS